LAGLIGEYNHTIDSKGRLSIPSKFRAVLGESFVISRGVDPCLIIYTEEDWNAFTEKISQLQLNDPSARDIKRFFGAGSANVEIDAHGRILIPSKLQAYAGLTKDVTIVGTIDGKAEIWDSARWEEKENSIDHLGAFDDLFTRGINI